MSVFADRSAHQDPSSLGDISLTITGSERAEAERAALAAACQQTLPARLAAEPVVNISFQ